MTNVSRIKNTHTHAHLLANFRLAGFNVHGLLIKSFPRPFFFDQLCSGNDIAPILPTANEKSQNQT